MIRLAWALPTVFSVLLLEAGAYTGFALPVPFFIIIICVIIAGSLGGQGPGLLAGIIASLFVAKSYIDQFGPTTLTGGLPQVAIGSMFFLLIGVWLGRLKDQRDSSVNALREIKLKLESSLRNEAAETEKQTAKVAERETRLKTAIRIAGVGHYSFRADNGNCSFCSHQHAAHFGLTPDEFITRTAGLVPQLFCTHPDDHQIVLDAMHQLNLGKIQHFEYRAVCPNGEIRHISQIEEPIFDDSGKMVESVGTSIDLTELREAEARVRQSQRIEAIGTLTGGVAHDFNNLLAIILGNLELSLEVSDDDERRDLTQSAIKATLRGADLTKNLLSFSRRAHLEPKRLNLNQLIQNTMTWGARVLPATIDVENSLMAELWDVELDPTSAENAIINILLNGRDAMPDGGKMTIETSNIRIGEEYVAERGEDIEPGRYVMLAISDTGHGIPSGIIEKVFEPFFTDKPVGLGSGLGLSMVQGFIKQSGGAIRVYSEVGVGTTFKLYFKAADQQAIKSRNEDHETHHPPSGKAAVLIAEDEEEVMQILKRILEDAGYAVTTAKNGDEALEIFQSSDPFDLLLTDVVMPGSLLGPGLAKAIRLIDPSLPCVFLSGYASEATVHSNGLKPSDIRLIKPVSRTDLLQAVSQAISSSNESE